MKRKLLALVLSLIMLLSMMPAVTLAEDGTVTPSEPIVGEVSDAALQAMHRPTAQPIAQPSTGHIFKHIDVRIAGAVLTVNYITKDAFGNILSTTTDTINASVTHVDSVTIDGITYNSGFTNVENSTYEYRKTSGVSIALDSLTENSYATLVVDLVDSKGTVYNNVSITYGYDGIIAAAKNCDGYTNGKYDGLDFDVGASKDYTINIICMALDVNVKKLVSLGGTSQQYSGEGGDITFTLTGSDSSITTATVGADGTAKFTLSYNYATDVGKTITYTLKETSVPAMYEANAQNFSFSVKIQETTDSNGNKSITAVPIGVPDEGFTFTNVIKPVDVTVTKSWNDADDQDGLRPDSITVNLLADGDVIDTQKITAADGWAYTWQNLPEYDGNTKINYTVSEESVAGYEPSISGTTIINNHTPETVSVSGSKVWQDGDDQDGLRPDSITVNLLADGDVIDSTTATAENGWTYIFSNLPKYKNQGTEIEYTVSEGPVVGYVSSVEGTTITNKHEVSKVSKSVTKVWDDADNQDGLRPGSVSVQLFADGEPLGSAVTLSEENSWTYTWTNLNEKNAGEKIDYTVEEVGTISGYSSEVTDDGEGDSFIVVNTHEVDLVDVSVTKAWDDADDQDGLRSDSVSVQLFADGTPLGSAVTLSAENGWTYTWADLDANKNGSVGSAIAYTVEEVGTIAGYTPNVSSDVSSDAFDYTITNIHAPAKTQFSVTKEWDDDDDRDGLRPDSVSVQLFANGEPLGSAVTLSEDNDWTHTWTGLDQYAASEEIVYSVEENVVPTGYVPKVEGSVIINKHSPITIEKTVTKIWEDGGNRDGNRPGAINVQLYANGEPLGAAVTLSETNNWTYIWTGLYEKEDGVDISYTVAEVDVPDDYESEVSNFEITNRYEVKTTSLSASKTWNDDENRDGIRPPSVEVTLKANGTAIASATLNDANDWTVVWTGLYVNENGKAIDYSVEETSVEGYTSVVTQNGTAFSITNTHKIETVSKAVSKVWDDDGNRDGVRPNSVTVQLLANGEVVSSAVLSEKNGWQVSWTDLPKNEAGVAIKYTVQEVLPEDSVYSVSYKDGTIVNSYIPDTTNVSVAKIWDDEGDYDGLRPESVGVQLYANGVACGDEITLSEENGWAYTWTDLLVNEAGVAIEYAVEETSAVPGYTAVVSVQNAYSFLIVNSHEVNPTRKTVRKFWDDDNDVDKLRPDSVTVQLMANGEAYGKPVVLTAEGGWKYTWEELPTFLDGELVNWTVRETKVADGYYVKYSKDTFSITNVHNIIPKTGSEAVSGGWWLLAAVSVLTIIGVLTVNGKKRRSC